MSTETVQCFLRNSGFSLYRETTGRILRQDTVVKLLDSRKLLKETRKSFYVFVKSKIYNFKEFLLVEFVLCPGNAVQPSETFWQRALSKTSRTVMESLPLGKPLDQ